MIIAGSEFLVKYLTKYSTIDILFEYIFQTFMTRKSDSQKSLTEAVKTLLWTEKITKQDELVTKLRQQGYDINQSKISRLLRNLLAIKVKDEDGQTVYRLSKEPLPPSTKSPLTQLVLDITANETLILVKTSPGSAPLIARLLDYHKKDSMILATIAGDDTIFIAPKSIQQIDQVLIEVKDSLESIKNKP